MTYLCIVKGKVDIRIGDVTEGQLGPTVAMWCAPGTSVEVFAQSGTADELRKVRSSNA